MPRGRPWEPNLELIEQLASRGLTQEQIAAACNIQDTTLSTKKGQLPRLAEAIRRGQARGIALVSNKLFESAMKGNVVAAVFYLKARAGWRDNIAVVEMTPEQIAAALAAHVQAAQETEHALTKAAT